MTSKARLLIGLLLALPYLALAQSVDLRQPVEKIEFGTWKDAAGSETTDEYTLSFPSAVTTAYPVNNMVPLRIFLPKGRKGAVPAVVILHYWGARDLKVERSLAEQLSSRGIGSVIMALPYHLGRTPPGYRSGELAIQPDPAALKATMRQAALDVKRTVDFIQSRPEFDSNRIGIAGTSLGALVSALAYGTEPRLSRAAFVLGGVDLARIMWTSSRVVQARDVLRRRGYTLERLQAELAPIEPLTYLGSRKDESPLVIGGRFDTVIPRDSTQALIDAFSNPYIIWLDTGHYGGIFVQSRVLKEVGNYFEAQFTDHKYAVPKRIYAPTLRIGVLANTATGFDIGAGIDLWKSNQRGDFTGTALLTPRGPQLFLGVRVSEGLSIGVVGATRRAGVGIFWSRVL